MFFFNVFPNIKYQNSAGQLITAKDITKRFKLVDSLLKNKYVLYTYSVKEGERADVIAHKYYGDATLDWLIYVTNNIYDPLMQWPMTYSEMSQYITEKYGSIEQAKNIVHEYYQIIQPKQKLIDGTFVDEISLVVDYTAYQNLVDDERSLITRYDWEKQNNEDRRIIKLIDKSFVPQIIAEYTNIFN